MGIPIPLLFIPFVIFPTPLTRHQKTERNISLTQSAPTSVVVNLTLDATDRIYTSFQGWLCLPTSAMVPKASDAKAFLISSSFRSTGTPLRDSDRRFLSHI